MSDKITQKDVIDSSVIKGISQLNAELKDSVKLMIDLTKEAISFRNATDPKNLQQVITAQKQSNDISEKSVKVNQRRVQSLTALEKERIRVENQKKKILAQTLALEEKGTKTLIKGQERLKIARKKSREEAQKALGVSKKSNGMFKSMTKSLIAFAATSLSIRAVFSIFKSSIKTIATFEEAMSKVRAVTGASSEDFDDLQKSAKLLGSTTSKTATEVSELQLEFAKLGFSTKEILNATDATISLSIAAGSDLAESAKVAASTIRGFGMDATDTKKIVDVMAASFSTTGLDLEKFKSAMSNAQVAAKSTNKTFEQTTAMLGTIVDTGTDASKAGTDLRVIFGKLAKKGIDLEDAYEKVNKSSNKVVTAMKLVGDRAFSSLITLAENKDKTDELTESYENSAGAAKEMARIMEDNLIGDIEKLSSAWKGFVLGLNKGDGQISITFRNITKGVTRLIGKLNELNSTAIEIGGNRAEKSFQATKDYILNQSEDLQGKRLQQEIDHEKKIIEISKNTLAEKEIDHKKAKKMIEDIGISFINTNMLISANSETSVEELATNVAEHVETLKLLMEFEQDLANAESERVAAAAKAAEEAAKAAAKAAEEKAAKEKADQKKREEEAWKHEVNLMRLTEKRYSDLDQMSKDYKDVESGDFDEELELWMGQQEALTDVEIEEINKRALANIQANEDKKQSIKDWTVFAINEAQNLSNSILGLLDSQITAQEAADIEKAESRGASEAEIEKIEAKAAKKRKDIALADAIIYTALAITKALFTASSWIEGIIAGVLVAAEGAIQIAAIESASFEKGTKDSGSEWIDATVSEKGREKVVLADGSSFYTPDQQSKMFLPPHSQVIPNHQLQNELAEMQAYGSNKGVKEQDEKRRQQEHKEMLEAIKNRDETFIDISENGLKVIAKSGANRTSYLNRKYRR